MTSQSSILILVTMVFGLGLRHGLDLDHLATIDAISRTLKDNVSLSKKVGLFFSLGHGLVVILLSVIIGSGLLQNSVPSWLEGFGNAVSICFLFIFGLITLYKVLFYKSENPSVLPTGFRAYFFKKYQGSNYNPLWIMFVGALFALSFDTFTQVALFSISMKMMAGWIFSIVLAVVFMIGMMASDGLNGFLIATVIQRADKSSEFLSRLFGLFIAGFSLVLACMEVF